MSGLGIRRRWCTILWSGRWVSAYYWVSFVQFRYGNLSTL